jgi:hypothetical protein
MREAQVITRIREYLAAELTPRDQVLGIALMHEQSNAARAGMLGGSRGMQGWEVEFFESRRSPT